MRVEWTGTKDEAGFCLALFTAFGAVLGFFMAPGSGGFFMSTALGAAAGLLFWSLFAMQDLRLTRR